MTKLLLPLVAVLLGRAGDVLGLDEEVGDDPRDPVEPSELGPLERVRT